METRGDVGLGRGIDEECYYGVEDVVGEDGVDLGEVLRGGGTDLDGHWRISAWIGVGMR